MLRRRIVSALGIVVALSVMTLGQTRPAAAVTYTPCPTLSATIAAESATEPAYLGLYKYTVQVAWDVGTHDPSHLDLLVGLRDCICVCDARLFKFSSPAGTSTGVNASGACTVPYYGEYVCKGDPSIRDITTGPAIKFNPNEATCATDETGSGTFVFYSPFPPGGPSVAANAIAIKHGTSTCYGALVGQFPVCDCSVPAHDATWGQLKVHYR